MTKLFIHSTNPEFAGRMKPDIYQRILKKRKELKQALATELAEAETITLEIGCGHGHFLTAYGETFPNEFCIGIDVNRGRIFKAKRKVDRAGLKTVRFFEGDSMEVLSLLPDHIGVAKTWILYPDPWPKKRHFKNRIIQADFLTRLAKVCKGKAQLFLRSDYKPYLDWSEELINESPHWTLAKNFDWPEVAMTVFQELTDNQHHSLAADLKPAKQSH